MVRALHDDMRESGLLPVFSRCIKNFKLKNQSIQYAHSLAESLHIVIKTYDTMNSNEGGRFRVKTKIRTANPTSQTVEEVPRLSVSHI